MRLWLWILIFCFTNLFCDAQLRFNHLGIENGLSQSSVNTVIRDRKGFYWIATQYGLTRFDGKNSRVFYTGNTKGLSDNFILNGLEDADGNIWWATRHNLCRYHLANETFYTIAHTDTFKTSSKGHNSIWRLELDKTGNILFTAAGHLLKIPRSKLSVRQPDYEFAVDEQFICASFFIAENTIYSLHYDTLYKLDKTAKHFIYKRQIPAWKNHTGYFIFDTPQKIISCNKKLFVLKKDALIEVAQEISKQTTINHINYINGKYYLGTENGLYETDDQFHIIRLYKHQPENSKSLSEDKVLSISRSNDGIIWIGNANTGVNWCDEGSLRFQLIKADEAKPYISFSCITPNDSVLLAGTADGVDVFKRTNNNWNFANHFFDHRKVTALCTQENNLWIGTSSGLFFKSGSVIKEVVLENTHPLIFDIKSTSKGQLIVSSVQGLYVLDGQTHLISKHIDKKTLTEKGEKILKSNYLFNTTLTKTGDYFLNTTMGSAELDSNFQFKKQVFDQFNYKSLSEIMITKSIPVKNDIWFGSLGNGIYKWNGANFVFYNQTHGLSNNVIASLETDAEGRIWASTNYGINCVDKKGIKSFVEELNISSPEFMTNGSYRNGRDLFFCSNSGVISFNPDDVLNDSLQYNALHLQLTSALKNYTDSIPISTNSIVLNYQDKTLQLGACVPGIRFFNQIKLAYQIKQISDVWVNFENGKSFQLANLPYGEYTLVIRAQLTGTKWQEAMSLKLFINPPFWRTTWFIVLVTGLSLSLITFSVWYLSRLRLKKQLLQLQIQQKVHEEKERISRDLHDNIGTQISALISGLDKISITGKTEQAEKLSDYARQTLGELRETIWALNAESVDLQTLKQKLEELAFNWRSVYSDIHVKFDIYFQTNVQLNPEQTLSYYRILQEAGSNALKHSECKLLEVIVSVTGNHLIAHVKDNGKGFDPAFRLKGHYGLDNMSARAKQAGIGYELKSVPGMGTEVILSLSLNTIK